MTSPNPGTSLIGSLDGLRAASDGGLEAIVVTRGLPENAAGISRAFPGARVIVADAEATIPEMRAAGLRAAQGAIVAMTTDHCMPGDGWLQALREAHRRGSAVVGGPLLFEGTGLVDWAVFVCEYGRYLPPVRAGATRDLAGHNVSYTRAALTAIDDLLPRGLWEPFWHQRLIERGFAMTCDPAVVVTLRKHYSFGGFVRERFHFARSFASQRAADRAWPIRLALAAATPLLPVMILTRTLWQILPKRRYAGVLIRTLPLLGVFVTVWAAGVCAGYALGGGASARRIV
jgi:hypothetical protein